MKHTPGPYYNNGPFIGSNIKDLNGNIRNNTIAEIVFHRTNGNSEDHANINLFKAAPDLLEACENWVSAMRQLAIRNPHKPIYYSLIKTKGFGRLEKAISKATI